ncbi:MAG: hypothetical protein RR404_01745 [Bacilli bacterium]
MKKLLSILFLCSIAYLAFTYQTNITEYILKNFINDKLIVVYDNNAYTKSVISDYKTVTNFYPNNKDDIINIFYTALNGGWDNVIFFCTSKYENCLNDVIYLSNQSNEFNKVNNYVHPYNSYQRLLLNYNNLGKVQINIEKLYSNDEIKQLNSTVDEIIKNNINEVMSQRDKIKVIHDYIINNTSYDKVSAEKVENNSTVDFKSHKANGSLIDNKAICGGYSDAMALFLNKFNIENYKISSEKHIWNYVKLDNTWLHLDLTWDDPVVSPPKDVLLYNFFLIDDEKLKELDTNQHDY